MKKESFDIVRAILGDRVVTQDEGCAVFVSVIHTVSGTPTVQFRVGNHVRQYDLCGRRLDIPRSHNPVELFMAAPEEPAEEPAPDYEPFDLERAQAGEPIMFRDGSEAKLVDYDERRATFQRVAAKNAYGYISFRSVTGHAITGNPRSDDLVMKPRTRTMELWERKWIAPSGRKHSQHRIVEKGKTRFWPNELNWITEEKLLHTWDEKL